METFDALDRALFPLYNQFARRSELADKIVLELTANLLFKGGLLMAILWGFWFRAPDPEQARRDRARILAMFLGMLAALAVARTLAHILPYRERPLYREGLFVPPYGITDEDLHALERGSSFPSDHAALFFCLASGIWSLSRRWGWAAFAYVTVVICLPRMYVGYHHLTDLLAGAALGLGITAAALVLAHRRGVVRWLVDTGLRWSERRESWFYALFFLLSFEVVELFESVRHIRYFRGLIG